MSIQLFSRRRLLAPCLALLLGLQAWSVEVPEGIVPVANFDLEQYLGTWHEVARFDSRFERHLKEVTATYTLKKNGDVRVENVGVDRRTGKRKTAVGTARFVSGPQTGHLKVSFFGPFYSSYVVFYLEEDYSVALVCGDSKDYCWILARKPALAEGELEKYRQIAQKNGFDVNKFVYPENTAATVGQESAP